MADNLDFDPIDLLNWRYRAVKWATLAGVLHGVIGLIVCLVMVGTGGLVLLWLPSLLFLAPSALHITASVGIARSWQWGWRMEVVFAWTHLAALLLAISYLVCINVALNHPANVLALAIACLLGFIGVGPLARLVYCLHRCRGLRWRAETNRPAFEVISRGSAE